TPPASSPPLPLPEQPASPGTAQPESEAITAMPAESAALPSSQPTPQAAIPPPDIHIPSAAVPAASAATVAEASHTGVQGGAGALLRQARESQQLSLESLAQSMKVPPERLRALEAENWSVLPDAVFTRSLALTLCRHLHIDAAPILALLPQAQIASLKAKGNLNEPVRPRGMPSTASRQDGKFKRKLLWTVLASGLLLAALYIGAQVLQNYTDYEPEEDGDSDSQELSSEQVGADLPGLLFAPQDESEELLESAAPAAGATTTAPPQGGNPPSSGATPADASASADPAASPPVPANTASASASSSTALAANPSALNNTLNNTPASDPSAPNAEAIPAVADNSAAPPNTNAALRLQAIGQTWVQVRGAKQQVLLERVLQPGEVYESSNKGGPLSVVIGQASVVQVQLNGKAFDLTPVTRGNVARFEVK
ncbi:MAG: helix-turn-helix domain-containing protein, partial [Comamonas sp.]|nr:helix-turn-helix domain-containing protein [Comamonas sp.]